LLRGSIAPFCSLPTLSLQEEDGVDAYCIFFTSGHLDSDNGWNAWSAGIVATSL
jgi:hypothetical protein